jgi:hypothetical protein
MHREKRRVHDGFSFCTLTWYKTFLSAVYTYLGDTLRVLRRFDSNGTSQMQGGKNWILPKEIKLQTMPDVLNKFGR